MVHKKKLKLHTPKLTDNLQNLTKIIKKKNQEHSVTRLWNY